MDEAPVWIALNGEPRIALTCSPLLLAALATGHLLAEAWIDNAAEIVSLVEVPGPGGSFGVRIEIPQPRVHAAEALRRHRLGHGCGLRHMLDCEPTRRRGGSDDAAADLTTAFRALFAAADAAAGGGVHAAAFCDAAGNITYTSVDVARHCAVDRAIGLAALAGARGAHGLVLSSRISGAIALKAVHARVPWIASRSIATPLAREIANAGGVRLIEQAVRRS